MAQRRLVEIVLQGKDESKGAFDSFANSLGLADAKMLKFAAGAAAIGTAVIAATKQLYDFTSEMAVLGDDLDKLSLRTGVAVDELSEFQFMIERSGGSVGDLEPAVRRMARSMSDARDGIKEATDAFTRMGISVSDLVDGQGNLRSVQYMLPLLADGLKNVQSQAERMDLAQTILGRGGTKLLPMLQEGSAAIRDMREEMQMFGGSMSEDFSSASASFVDSQTNLENATQRLKEALAEPFMAPFTEAVNLLAKSIAKAQDIAAATSAVMAFLPGLPGAHGRAFGVGHGDPYAGGYQDWVNSGMPGMRSPLDPGGGGGRGGGSGSTAPDGFFGPPTVEPPRGPQNFNPAPGLSPEDLMVDMDIEDELRNLERGYEGAMENMSQASQFAAANMQSAMAGAFAAVITDADNAAEAIKGIFVNAIAQIASQFLAAGLFSMLGLPVSGPFAGAFGKSAGKSAGGPVVSGSTKSMPSSVVMAQYGTMNMAAASAAAKGYI